MRLFNNLWNGGRIMSQQPNSRLDLGELHKILLKACPAVVKGSRSIRGSLAPALGVSHQYVYRWISEGRVPAKYVRKIVEVSEDRVSIDELLPYVIS